MGAEDWRERDHIESVRRRPGMYVGGTDFFGFIHYLVGPVALLLAQGPKWVGIAAGEDGFVVEADVAVPIEDSGDGRIVPFEYPPTGGPGFNVEGIVLTGLSERLEVEVRRGDQAEVIRFRRGERQERRSEAVTPGGDRTVLRFAPDPEFFTVTDLDPAVFASYVRRNSFLRRGVRFSLSIGGTTREFVAERGIADLFDAVAAPYQIMNEPIRIEAEEGSLRIEAVFAYQSWTDDVLWCFMNGGRAVEGGTHERGLREGFRKISRTIWKPKDRHPSDVNGIIGVVSLWYPEATWEGCIKAKIGNPELRKLVRELLSRESMAWMEAHPEEVSRVRQIGRFSFPDAWGRL